MKQIAVLDYGIGNVRSQLNALEAVGAHPVLTHDADSILSSAAVILPGVGAFRHGMENLQAHGLVPVIRQVIENGKPFLGICLGMQLLFEDSDEFGVTAGLGLIKGHITRLPMDEGMGLKLPHIGWTEIEEPQQGRWTNTILDGTTPHSSFYFVHSYAAVPARAEDILATARFGSHNFCCAIQKDNIYGALFHPEKSGESGLTILKTFTQIIQ